MSEQQPKPEAEQEQIEGQQNTSNVQQPNVTPYFFVEKLRDSALRIHWVKHEKNLRAEKECDPQPRSGASRSRGSVADGSPELMPAGELPRAAALPMVAWSSGRRRNRCSQVFDADDSRG